MPTPAILPGAVVQGDLTVTGSILPSIDRTDLAIDQNACYLIPWEAWRVWDSYSTPLPGDGQLEAASTDASYYWDPTSADDTFFVAGRAYRVLGITARVEVAGTDAGAVTAAIKKAASGTDIASGTALHSGTVNLKGTVDTNQSLTLSATSSDLDIAAGTSIGIDFTGTLTAARGCVSVLLAPAASPDDLRLVGGTFATNAPSIQAGDLKAAGATTRYARCVVQIPPNFVTGGTLIIRAHAGMKTTVADTSCTIDFSAHRSDLEDGVGSDLVSTAATSINSLTEADKDFTVDASTLLAGDYLDIRMAITCTDGATGTAVIPFVGSVEILLDIRG